MVGLSLTFAGDYLAGWSGFYVGCCLFLLVGLPWVEQVVVFIYVTVVVKVDYFAIFRGLL